MSQQKYAHVLTGAPAGRSRAAAARVSAGMRRTAAGPPRRARRPRWACPAPGTPCPAGPGPTRPAARAAAAAALCSTPNFRPSAKASDHGHCRCGACVAPGAPCELLHVQHTQQLQPQQQQPAHMSIHLTLIPLPHSVWPCISCRCLAQAVWPPCSLHQMRTPACKQLHVHTSYIHGTRVSGVITRAHDCPPAAPANTQPAAHMSTEGPYAVLPNSSSGARYQRANTCGQLPA